MILKKSKNFLYTKTKFFSSFTIWYSHQRNRVKKGSIFNIVSRISKLLSVISLQWVLQI